ncbi:MAG: MarR family transcriptional regulator [Thaumarchaeota archaeon]|nr:MarR family transcriptional regulator [Nitrososphaerota archaeon]
MDRNAGLALATVMLALSTFIAALKLIQPASLSVYIFGSNGTKTLTSVPGLYTFTDILTVSLSMLLAGISASYLVFSTKEIPEQPIGQTLLDERRTGWEALSKMLKEDEAKIYQAVLDAGGVMNQGDLGRKVGLSKTTVSRTLELLESRGLIEKRRRGMGNVILLK